MKAARRVETTVDARAVQKARRKAGWKGGLMAEQWGGKLVGWKAAWKVESLAVCWGLQLVVSSEFCSVAMSVKRMVEKLGELWVARRVGWMVAKSVALKDEQTAANLVAKMVVKKVVLMEELWVDY